MANYLEAIPKVLIHEGRYDNDPDDVGGETYYGIARHYWPAWLGWPVLDAHRELNGVPSIDADSYLYRYVLEFYKANFWDRLRLDEIVDQETAFQAFDTEVVSGLFRTAGILQSTANLLNRNGELYRDIVEDNFIGPETVNAVNQSLLIDTQMFLKLFLGLRIGLFVEACKLRPKNEKYMRGWLNRVDLIIRPE